MTKRKDIKPAKTQSPKKLRQSKGESKEKTSPKQATELVKEGGKIRVSFCTCVCFFLNLVWFQGRKRGRIIKTLSPELAALVGQDAITLPDLVKKVWAIVKERNLFDPDNRRYAICDDALFKVMGVKRFRVFTMMKYLKNHVVT